MASDHRPQDYEEEYDEEDDDYEDDEEFLSGRDFDGQEDFDDMADKDTISKGFDTGVSKSTEDTQLDPHEKVYALFGAAEMQVCYNPNFYDIPEDQFAELLNKLLREGRCVKCKAELDIGIITITVNPAIQIDRDYSVLCTELSNFIKSKKTKKEG